MKNFYKKHIISIIEREFTCFLERSAKIKDLTLFLLEITGKTAAFVRLIELLNVY